MLQKLQEKLKTPVNFPSPPGIAQQIITIANDPDVSLARVAEVVGKDPGLAAKILRTANSPMYAQRRRSENLRQALIVLGLNAATTLALSFSLLAGFKSGKGNGFNYPRFWKRAILGAVVARTLGEQVKLHAGENLFLAGLLQDIAVLALDRTQPDFYAKLPPNPTHKQMCEYEKGKIEQDHAAVAAWLFRQWKLPEQICVAVEASHEPDKVDISTPQGRFSRCVGFASEVVEVFLDGKVSNAVSVLAPRAQTLLHLEREQLGQVLKTIIDLKPEVEALFETTLLAPETSTVILDQARELLALRSLQSMQQVTNLQKTTDQLVARAEALEDQYRRDALTGLFNRRYLDQYLADEFAAATLGGWPVSVIFVDLDHFKRVNDTYGHQAGDIVLRGAARVLLSVVRESDVVGRFGGEEFLIVLPSIDATGAGLVCSRLLQALRDEPHHVGGHSLVATASLGLATCSSQQRFGTPDLLVEAADRALYAAKRAGRNQWARYADKESEPIARAV